MGLPKIDMPIFSMVLPSTKEEVLYRAFTVKEEKILLIARESRNLDQIMIAIKQVINNCLVNKNVDDLTMVDLEYAMMTVRAQSVDGEITFNIADPDTKEQVELQVLISDIKLHEFPDHTNQIKISDEYTLFMRYPTIAEVLTMLKGVQSKKTASAEFEVMFRCMERLASQDEVFEFAKFSDQEITDFVDSLDPKAIKKIEAFFNTMPQLRHEIPYTNSEGKAKTFVIQGIQTFFI